MQEQHQGHLPSVLHHSGWIVARQELFDLLKRLMNLRTYSHPDESPEVTVVSAGDDDTGIIAAE